MPLISVVIPVYNGEKYITEAIRSVLAQQYERVEIIVVNDGSTDGTLDKLAAFGADIQVVSQVNLGQAAARNRGIQQARGDILGLLDADDLWPRARLAVMLPHLASGYDVVRGKVVTVSHSGHIEPGAAPGFREPLVGACLYRKEVFGSVGLFDESMRAGEDFDWNLRLKETPCTQQWIDEVTLYYRRHDANMTNSREVMEQGQLRAFANKIRRQKSL